MNNRSTSVHLKKGVIWTLLNRFSVVGMQFLAMIVLARFLKPSDFAIMGIAMFFISISEALLDSGMGGSLLRKREVEDIDYSTLFLYNIGVAVIMYLVLIVLSKPISIFYGKDELISIINVIGISIIISGFGKIQNIVLYRELKFKIISIISILSSSIALMVAIFMAIKGFGVWALVIQNLMNNLLVVLFQFCYNRYFPRLRFSTSSFLEQWEYGSHLLYSHLLTTIYQNIFSMIFPKVSSYTFSGLFAQANKIQQIPSSIINSVVQGGAFPILARINDKQEFVNTTKAFNRKAYLISFFVLFALSVFSRQIIAILLGDTWIEAAPILSTLAIGGIGIVISMMVRNTFKSMGLTNSVLRIEIIRALTGMTFLAITFTFGDYYILLGIVFTNFLTGIVAMYFLAIVSTMTFLDQIKDI
ncbi:MAG: lipopolysaccharide biosynthesis protein, partial [Bacteroidales bacterium]